MAQCKCAIVFFFFLPVRSPHSWYCLTKSRFFTLCFRSRRYFEWAAVHSDSLLAVVRCLSVVFCDAQHTNSFDLLAVNAARVGENSAFVKLCRRLRFLWFNGCDPIVVSLSKYSSGCEDKQLGQFIKRILCIVIKLRFQFYFWFFCCCCCWRLCFALFYVVVIVICIYVYGLFTALEARICFFLSLSIVSSVAAFRSTLLIFPMHIWLVIELKCRLN